MDYLLVVQVLDALEDLFGVVGDGGLVLQRTPLELQQSGQTTAGNLAKRPGGSGLVSC